MNPWLRLTCVFLLASGCGPASHDLRGASRERPPSSGPAASEECALHARPTEAPELPSALLAVAPQYFHASHRGGFDAYLGGPSVFPWYDVHDLAHPITPPGGARVHASTRTALFVLSGEGELGVLERGSSTVRWTGASALPIEAVDLPWASRPPPHWVLTRSADGFRVLEIEPDGTVFAHPPVPPGAWHDRRITRTVGGRLVLAWLEREGGALRVKVRFGLDEAIVVDEVVLPEPVAELSERSRVELSVAAHGREVGVAWRPLVDPTYRDVGSASEPPMTPARAEVRWIVVGRDGTHTPPYVHATVAHPLGGVTGIGPWPLTGNGMEAATLHGRAVFVWLDEDGIRGALAGREGSVLLAPREGAPLLMFRSRGQGAEQELELLALDSSPHVDAWGLRCE